MYKSYPVEEYQRVTAECADRIKKLLQTRYDELEETRDAINDRYPFEDLYLKWAEVDDEEKLISQLIKHLDICAAKMIEEKRESDMTVAKA